jgi:hypothetical protein
MEKWAEKWATPFSPTTWDREHNPFLSEWWVGRNHYELGDSRYYGSSVSAFAARTKSIEKYGFAVPTEKVLREILKVSPKGIVEIGAGSGYWSKLLQLLGADIIACDDGSGLYPFKVGAFFPVEPVGYQQMFRTKAVHERTLLVVWPSVDNVKIFNSYKGDTVVYVGEIGEGCTGYDAEIEKTWEMVKHVEIPMWDCIHDSLGIFKRKGR